MGKRKMIAVVDVEATGRMHVYDIGIAITDLYGNIVETYSAIVEDVFCGMGTEMQSAYYAEKIPQYVAEIENGSRQLKKLSTIRAEVLNLLKQYHAKSVYAYNMTYDKNALDKTVSLLSNGFVTSFFEDVKYCCIWRMSTETFLQKKDYAKQAIVNGWISESGNIKSSAECAYRYISGDKVFEEEHTGLEDVLIEVQILCKARQAHKKIPTEPNNQCWRKVQKYKHLV